MLQGQWYLSFASFDPLHGQYVPRYISLILPIDVKRSQPFKSVEEAANTAAVKLWESDLVLGAYAMQSQGGLDYPPKNPQVVYVRGLQIEKKNPAVALALAA